LRDLAAIDDRVAVAFDDGLVLGRGGHREQHGKRHSQQPAFRSAHLHLHHNPLAACATARNSARPLFMVSSHSFCGSESNTMPAPACTCRRPSWMTAVRMAMAVSASPCQPM